MNKGTCLASECERLAEKREWCRPHYKAGLKDGSIPRLNRPTKDERFWSKVNIQGPDDCWQWLAAKSADGYGAFFHDGAQEKAHRYSFRLVHGGTIDQMIDHQCHNRACVNPRHLRPASNKQNQENRNAANRNSQSGVRGVTWDADRRKWSGIVTHKGKSYRAGRFDSLAEAEQATAKLRADMFSHSQN